MSSFSRPQELSGFERYFVRNAANIKPWMYGIVMGLCIPFVQIVFQSIYLPLIIIAFVWSVISLQHFVSMKFAFLPEAAPRDIPVGQFTETLDRLEKTVENLDWLGFEEIDRFYLKRSHNIVAVTCKHREKNIYWLLISFVGRLTYSELFSTFDNNLALNTININAGHFPRPPFHYAQVLPNNSYEDLLEAHQDGCAVLAEHGYSSLTIPLDTFRDQFTRGERTILTYMFTKPLWAFRINLWLLLQAGRKYRKPLREQLRLGTVQLPCST
jgi:hypothetical protein